MADVTDLTTIIFAPHENAWSDGKTNCYEFEPRQEPVQSTPGVFTGQCLFRNKVSFLTLLVDHENIVICGDETGENIYRFLPSEAPARAALGKPVKVPLDCPLSAQDGTFYALPQGQPPVELLNYTGVDIGFGGGIWYVKL